MSLPLAQNFPEQGAMTIAASDGQELFGYDSLRDSVTIYNAGSGTLYVGRLGVNASTGYPIASGASLSYEGSEGLYGWASGASCDVRWLAVRRRPCP